MTVSCFRVPDCTMRRVRYDRRSTCGFLGESLSVDLWHLPRTLSRQRIIPVLASTIRREFLPWLIHQGALKDISIKLQRGTKTDLCSAH